MKTKTPSSEFPHVVIVGGGFGGLNAARKLAGQPVQVTLVDRNNYHLFQPLLYQVATAGVSPDEIAYPLRSILRRQENLTFRLAEVTGVDLAGRTLQTSAGEMGYDALILAAGGQTNYFGVESVARHSFGLKDLQDAAGIRNHLLKTFERASGERDAARRQAMLTYVVTGGGPTGVEMAGAIAELARLVSAKDFPNQDLSDVRVILLEATEHILPGFSSDLGQAALKALRAKNVEVRLGALVTGYDGSLVTLADGDTIPTHSLIWAAGVRSASLVDMLGVAQAAQRRVRVAPTLQIPGHAEVFVIGDSAYLEDDQGQPLPMVAPVAIQQGQRAGDNVLRLLDGQPLTPFIYRDPGSLATIGRNQAVVRLGHFKFHGFLAWLVWLVVHIYQLIGFRNRLVVLINWAWDYFLYERAVRLIVPGETESVGSQSTASDAAR